jgi:hypothetical protein
MDDMKNTSLYDQWRAMDDRRLVSKPVSVRLPVHVLARVNSIAEIFPTKTRTDILTDLLKAGLDAFEESLPPVAYEYEPTEVEDELFVCDPVGVTADYKMNANKHYQVLEQELGNNEPDRLFELSSKRYTEK